MLGTGRVSTMDTRSVESVVFNQCDNIPLSLLVDDNTPLSLFDNTEAVEKLVNCWSPPQLLSTKGVGYERFEQDNTPSTTAR